jgi:hypothetical protein
VWRARTILSGFLLAGLALLAAALLAPPLAPSSASGPAAVSTCPVHYHPVNLTVASCSVPSGGTFDPCSILTGGATRCPTTLADFNPADWFGWLACAVSAEASAIWDSIVGFVDAYIIAILDDIGHAITGAFYALLDAIQNAVLTGTQYATSGVTVAVQALTGAYSWAAPVAPLLAEISVGTLIVLGIVALYFVTILIIAGVKTAFNLL